MLGDSVTLITQPQNSKLDTLTDRQGKLEDSACGTNLRRVRDTNLPKMMNQMRHIVIGNEVQSHWFS